MGLNGNGKNTTKNIPPQIKSIKKENNKKRKCLQKMCISQVCPRYLLLSLMCIRITWGMQIQIQSVRKWA